MSLLSELFALLLINKVTFITILVEETIYNRLIKLNLVDIILKANSIDTQLIKIKAIIIEFRATLLEAIKASGLSRSFRPSES